MMIMKSAPKLMLPYVKITPAATTVSIHAVVIYIFARDSSGHQLHVMAISVVLYIALAQVTTGRFLQGAFLTTIQTI